MGVRFGREYQDIITDFSDALSRIPDCYECFEMTDEDWQQLEHEERDSYVRTLADDLFYGLGVDPEIQVGSGEIRHDPSRHVLQVTTPDGVVQIVRLI